MAAHGFPRSTGDIDIWIRPAADNAACVWRALARFGAPRHDLSLDDLASADVVFQIGLAPRRIDLLTSIDGVEFDEAWPHRVVVDLEGVRVPVIGRAHLIRNKRASGRPRDLADLAWLDPERT